MSLVIEQALPSIEQFPQTFAIALSDYSAISLVGEEQSKYLQGQVTCDVNSATESSLLHGAHCDAKGKTFSVFRFINRENAHLLIQPKSSIGASIKELQKFGVFAKVDISKASNLNFFALVGEQAASLLQQQFKQVPDSLTPVIQAGTTTLVYIAGETERYLLIDDSDAVENFIVDSSLAVFSSAVWQLLEIVEGFPVLSENAVSQYVPQMLNVQAIHGICFTKGCYLGQETVARMQYLGKNKRALYSLSGQTETPAETLGDSLEKQLGENWRGAGDILASYQADDGQIYVQAVLANDLENSDQLRVKAQPELSLTISPLPYSLTQS